MPARRTVAVLVVTYNHEDEIVPCIQAALDQGDGDFEVEVVVVDNGSRDATMARLDTFGDRIRLVGLAHNTGYAEGVNTAFAISTGDPVLLLNPDAIMDPGCIAALLAHLDAEPRSGGAGALLRDLGTEGLQRFCRRDPDLRAVAWTMTEMGRRLDAKRGMPMLNHRRYETEWKAGIDGPISVDCPAAACVLVRRELMGPRPLDPDLPLFFNDAELWRRIRRQGFTLDVIPAAGATHGYGTSVKKLDDDRRRAEWIAALRLYLAPELSRPKRALLVAMLLGDAAAAMVLLKLGKGLETTHAEIRGTLGGLGLPKGASPWLTPVGRRARAGR